MKKSLSFFKKIFRKLTKSDILLCFLLLFFSISGMVYPLFKKKNEKAAYIYVNDAFFKEVSLQKNREIKVAEHIIIEVKNGMIRMKENNCKGQHCVKQKWSNRMPIICVPNRILIEIKDEDDIIISY